LERHLPDGDDEKWIDKVDGLQKSGTTCLPLNLRGWTVLDARLSSPLVFAFDRGSATNDIGDVEVSISVNLHALEVAIEDASRLPLKGQTGLVLVFPGGFPKDQDVRPWVSLSEH